MKKLFVLWLCCLFTGCSYIPPSTPEQAKQERIKMLSQVDLSNGVDAKEADILGGLYFVNFVSGCGVTGKPIDRGDYWELEMYIGIAAQKSEDNIKIDKQTGKISLRGRPALTKPIEELTRLIKAPEGLEKFRIKK